jgi:hypothetical protein
MILAASWEEGFRSGDNVLADEYRMLSLGLKRRRVCLSCDRAMAAL